MYIKYKPISVFWHFLISACTTFSVLYSSGIMSGNFRWQFQFFDYDIAILTAVYYFILAFWQMGSSQDGKTSLWIGFKFTLITNLCLIFLVSMIIIYNGDLPEDADIKFIFSRFTVYILPFLVLMDWLLFDSKGNFKNNFIFFAFIPIVLYGFTVYLLTAIGGITGFYDYPYFFMDLGSDEWKLHFSLLAVIQIAFLVLCYLLVVVDGLPALFSGITAKFKKSEG